jgi:hypothetical protein
MRLALDFLIIHHCVTDDAFWSACPEFVFLREMAAHVRGQIVDKIKQNPGCVSCGNVRHTLSPLVEAFTRQILTLNESSPESLAKLKTYVQSRRKRPPDSLVVYYAKDGKTFELEF